jgi:pyruvate,water dikinase
LGVAAVVGTGDATRKIRDGQPVTVSCAEGQHGQVYAGRLRWTERTIDLSRIERSRTQAMLILADPSKAFTASFLPCGGVGLMRLEFAIARNIGVHPMALAHFDRVKDRAARRKIIRLTAGYRDKKKFFTDRLAQAVAVTAAAFHPREVIVRMSDFKSNEYAGLLGGRGFEEKEENPMLGFRGASRYDHDRYRDGFRLECLAMKRVRDEMGLTNVKLMIPFCRTVEEGRRVVALMESYGLKRGENGLEIYLMVEIPSNVILMEAFGALFDGFSIGSNDLTQLTLGIDRDSTLISASFDERGPASRELIARAVKTARKLGKPIGLCGQAPSDWPEFAEFLISTGIHSISFNADALLRGMDNMKKAETKRQADREYIPL